MNESANNAGLMHLKGAVDHCIRRPLLILGLISIGLIIALVGTSWEDAADLQQRSFLVAAAVRFRAYSQSSKQACPIWFQGMYEDLAPWKVSDFVLQEDSCSPKDGAKCGLFV